MLHKMAIILLHLQLFALAYHQSRWNYNSEKDVAEYVHTLCMRH